MNRAQTVIERLRDETQPKRGRLAGQLFFRALAAGNLSQASYVGLLRALSVLYEAFEQAIAQAHHPQLAASWDASLRKLPLIDRDLAFFQSQNIPQTPAATLRAHVLTQMLRARAQDDPISLLGYLYVLAGPPLGDLLSTERLAALARPSDSGGLAYVSSYKAAGARWKTIAERLTGDLADPAVQERIVAAAAEAFAGVEQIVQGLHPLDMHPLRELARELNPAAGSHAIPADPREIQAALRAGERSWRQFPYYQLRYGERGAQFTRSDSAWLVTLAEHPQPIVNQHIHWLGRVLAARGMPQWLLEQHLELLYAELAAAIPERSADYARLQQAAQGLRDQRRQYVGDRQLAAHTAAFDALAGAEWSARLPQTGGLLAAAVADEQIGIAQAAKSVESWITDPARFPSQWIKAVRSTLRAARRQAKAAQPKA